MSLRSDASIGGESHSAPSKEALRVLFRSKLKAIPPIERALGSAQACSLLKGQKIWQSAHSVLFYHPLPEELDVWPLLTAALGENKQVCLPRYLASDNAYVAALLSDIAIDLRQGQFGIREACEHCPVMPLNQLDLILVPGISFDLQGRRLGRGKGYYDRLLAAVRGTKCGLAFDQQITTEIPAEPHDITLDYIVTPTRCLPVSNSART
jgi:5-formyltetrahydrofolate cyclo-ligase